MLLLISFLLSLLQYSEKQSDVFNSKGSVRKEYLCRFFLWITAKVCKRYKKETEIDLIARRRWHVFPSKANACTSLSAFFVMVLLFPASVLSMATNYTRGRQKRNQFRCAPHYVCRLLPSCMTIKLFHLVRFPVPGVPIRPAPVSDLRPIIFTCRTNICHLPSM